MRRIFLGISTANFQLTARENGKIESYRFGNKSVDISVSKAGGHIIYMRKNRLAREHVITVEQAVEKAKRFLLQNGIKKMAETYYFIDEGVCTINFAYVDGATLCYTDLIKVGVAMDDGEVVLYEAGGYISNHKNRAFESAVYTEKQAAKKLNEKLKILKTDLVLIPTSAGKETRCYEFLCSDQDTEVLVYINVLTCEQEDILILLKSDAGTLVK